MRIIQSKLALLAASGTACLALAGSVLVANQASAEGRPTIAGAVAAADGSALSGVTVVASVEPKAEDVASMKPGATWAPKKVGSAVTGPGGAFTLRVTDPATLRARTGADGLASVILSSATAKGQVYYRVRLQRTAKGSYVGYKPDAESDLAASPSGQLLGAGVARRQSRISSYAQGVPQLSLVAMATPKGAASGGTKDGQGTSFDPDIWCGPGATWYWKRSKYTAGRNVAVVNQSTAGKSVASFSYTETKGTSFEIGITGRKGQLEGTAGFAKGKSSSGVVGGTSGLKQSRQYYIGEDFALWDVMCSSTTTGARWRSGYTEYRPIGWDGGSSYRTWKPFTCRSARNESPIGPGMHAAWQKGTTGTMNGAFTVGTGSLRVQQVWSSEVSQRYDAKDRKTSFVLCGDTAKWNRGVTSSRQMP